MSKPIFNIPKVTPGRKSTQDLKDREAELEAIAAALREDLPAEWEVRCVGGYSLKQGAKREYLPGHRWIEVSTPWGAFEICSEHGYLAAQLGRFHRIEIPIEAPDSLDRLSREFVAAALAYRDGTQVGN